MIDRALFLSADGQTFDGKRAVPNEAVTKLMLSLADLQPGEKVLEIGAGSGYQTFCLAEAAADVSVRSVDVDTSGFNNEFSFWYMNSRPNPPFIHVLQDNGLLGWPIADHAPFDCIVVSCGMTSIPPAYEEQLREGGRLIIPLGKPEDQELLRLEKRNGKLVMGRVGGYCRFQMCV